MKPDKALEWINTPHPRRPVRLADVLVDMAVFAGILALGWLVAVGVDRLFTVLGI